ncbi:MAG: competence protein ComEC [Clostridia bacterium]|nr:competence protein ComEC [Clostridia bacterium]
MASAISTLAFIIAVLLGAKAGWLFSHKSKKKAKRLFYNAFLAFFLSIIVPFFNTLGESFLSSDNTPSFKNIQTSTILKTRTLGDNSEGFLYVHYLDVNQGDAILIRLPNNQNILIDGGSNKVGPKLVNYLKQYGVRKLDYVIGTHPHEDHIGGLDLVIKAFEIGKVYMPKVTTNTDTYRDLLLAIKNKGLKVTNAKAGVTLPLNNEVKAIFISPNKSTYEELNDYSAVLHLTYGKTSFLFTGDAETTAEKEMVVSNLPLKADILKVGHHGSISSTSKAFLRKVDPTYAVISVGKDNDYGHPHPSIIERLQQAKIKIYRTDLHGTITAISDGDKITMNKKL